MRVTLWGTGAGAGTLYYHLLCLSIPSRYIIYNRTGIAFDNALKTRRGRSTFHVRKDEVSLLGSVAHGRPPAEYQASYRMGVK